MTNWKKHKPHNILYKGSEGFYQQFIIKIDEEKIFADIVGWELRGKLSYELKIQIPEEISITGMTINVTEFSYHKLDFDLIEKHARKIIKSLTK